MAFESEERELGLKRGDPWPEEDGEADVFFKEKIDGEEASHCKCEKKGGQKKRGLFYFCIIYSKCICCC